MLSFFVVQILGRTFFAAHAIKKKAEAFKSHLNLRLETDYGTSQINPKPVSAAGRRPDK